METTPGHQNLSSRHRHHRYDDQQPSQLHDNNADRSQLLSLCPDTEDSRASASTSDGVPGLTPVELQNSHDIWQCSRQLLANPSTYSHRRHTYQQEQQQQQQQQLQQDYQQLYYPSSINNISTGSSPHSHRHHHQHHHQYHHRLQQPTSLQRGYSPHKQQQSGQASHDSQQGRGQEDNPCKDFGPRQPFLSKATCNIKIDYGANDYLDNYDKTTVNGATGLSSASSSSSRYRHPHHCGREATMMDLSSSSHGSPPTPLPSPTEESTVTASIALPADSGHQSNPAAPEGSCGDQAPVHQTSENASPPRSLPRGDYTRGGRADDINMGFGDSGMSPLAPPKSGLYSHNLSPSSLSTAQSAPCLAFNIQSPPRSSAIATTTDSVTGRIAAVPAIPSDAGNATGYFAYCLDRGNGLFARLIPADMLPPIKGIVPLQSDCRGMMVLQDPSAQRHPGALSPPSGPLLPMSSVNAGAHMFPAGSRHAQNFVGVYNPIPGPSNPSLNQRQNRRNKTYCDKWIHDGTCAFTQQGCKYKHEMPHDRATQLALGLFQGFPAWYKKWQQDQKQQHQLQHQVSGAVDVSDINTSYSGAGIDISSPLSPLIPPTAFPRPPAAVEHQSAPLLGPPGLFNRSMPTFSDNGGSVMSSGRDKDVLGDNGSGNKSIDGPWRALGNTFQAAPWSSPPRTADSNSNDRHNGSGNSVGQLAKGFDQNLNLNEAGHVEHHQKQHQYHHQHHQQPTSDNRLNSLTSPSGLSQAPIANLYIGHGRSHLSTPANETGFRAGELRGEFGPICPPGRTPQEFSPARVLPPSSYRPSASSVGALEQTISQPEGIPSSFAPLHTNDSGSKSDTSSGQHPDGSSVERHQQRG